jgi:hypothetical protein
MKIARLEGSGRFLVVSFRFRLLLLQELLD